MGNSSWFAKESNVHFRDEELREHLDDVNEGGDWASYFADWYASPKRQAHMRRDLALPKAKRSDGLPKLTFAVLDGCQIAGYSDAEESLAGFLDELAGFLAAPPSANDGKTGHARFTVEGGAEFTIAIDYAKETIALALPKRTRKPMSNAAIASLFANDTKKKATSKTASAKKPAKKAAARRGTKKRGA